MRRREPGGRHGHAGGLDGERGAIAVEVSVDVLDRVEEHALHGARQVLHQGRLPAVHDSPSSDEYIGRSPEGTRAGLGAARFTWFGTELFMSPRAGRCE